MVLLSIIGCGNSNRSDDGAGVYVAQCLIRKLAENKRDDLRIFDAGTAGMDVMFQARGSSALIIIDANSSGSEPGVIFEVPGETLETCPEPSFGLHDFRWNHALFAGRKIFKEQFPKDITVYLIEAENLAFGLELSEVVKTAADRVIEKIMSRIASFSPLTSSLASTSSSFAAVPVRPGPTPESAPDSAIEPAPITTLATVRIRGGNLYVDSAMCKRFFPGIETIALLKNEHGFLLMPLHSHASGGRLLKLRNTAGDRVVTATDFLQDCGLDEGIDNSYAATWKSDDAALFVDLRKSLVSSEF